MLRALLESRMKAEQLSTRAVAKQVGTSHTTIVRALRGDIVDQGTLINISNWLNVIPSTLQNSASSSDDALAYQISALLKHEPKLAKVFDDFIQQVIQGKVDPAIIDEVVAFIAFRLNWEDKSKKE
jgi:transcriptional regulator with XRE-family HTH domain